MNDKDINNSEYKTLEYINKEARSDNSNIQIDAIKERVHENRMNKVNGELPKIF